MLNQFNVICLELLLFMLRSYNLKGNIMDITNKLWVFRNKAKDIKTIRGTDYEKN